MFAQRFLEQGYFLDVDPNSPGGGGHMFCGPCASGTMCPNCSLPLLQLLSLDLGDSRLGLSGFPARRLPLLFCWRCELAQAPFSYRVRPTGNIELLNYGKGRPHLDFPYEHYPAAFPAARSELRPLTLGQQTMIVDLNAGKSIYPAIADGLDVQLPRHQVGGEPYLVQPGSGAMDCPTCKVELPLFAVIGDETIDGKGFTANAFVQVLYFLCAKCAVVGAYQTCD